MLDWTPRFDLASFGALPERVRAEVVGQIVETVAFVNRHYLTAHPETPKLYASGVRFEAELPACLGGVNWCRDIPATLRDGCGHCVALAAWRIAELREAGERVSTRILYTPLPTGPLFHVVLVRQNDTQEDPSRILGMPP